MDPMGIKNRMGPNPNGPHKSVAIELLDTQVLRFRGSFSRSCWRFLGLNKIPKNRTAIKQVLFEGEMILKTESLMIFRTPYDAEMIIYIYIYVYTLPNIKTNIAPENRPYQEETIVFQPSIFRC